MQTLCRESLPKEDHVVNEDGSLVTIAAKKNDINEETEEDVLMIIANYIRSCGPTGIRYIREVLKVVNKATRNAIIALQEVHISIALLQLLLSCHQKIVELSVVVVVVVEEALQLQVQPRHRRYQIGV